MQQQGVKCNFADSIPWVILSPIEQSIRRKIESIGTPLKDWDITFIVESLPGITMRLSYLPKSVMRYWRIARQKASVFGRLTYTTQYLAPQRCIAYHSYRIPVSALFRLESGSLYSNIWLYTAGYCSLNAFSAFSEAPVIDSSNWYGKCQGIYISHCPAQSYPYLFISLPRRIGGFF